MTTDLCAAALRYADLGLEVFPLGANKAPATQNGMKDATSDPTRIAAWWAEMPDALIGCRIPEGFVVVDIDPRHGGLEVWSALLEHHGLDLPETRTHLSGRGDGGAHVWLRLPDDHGRPSVKRLDQWAEARGLGHRVGSRWSCGLDLLHHGHRYTILPPSPHPATGAAYRWADPMTGPTAPIIDCPGWLAELLTRPEPVVPSVSGPARDDSIADWWSDTHTWSWLLPRHGWVLVRGDGDSDGSAWRHPMATSDVSATIRHRCLFVYTPNTAFEPTEPDDPAGVTLFRAWATLEHGGDLSAAARAAHDERGDPHPDAVLEAWLDGLPVVERPTLAELVDDDSTEPGQSAETFAVHWATDLLAEPPERAAVLVEGLVRVGEMTAMAAERNAGKTWWALNLGWALATGEPFAGHFAVPTPRRVLYLSGEADHGAVAWRLQMMGRARWPHGARPEGLATTADRWRIRMVERRRQAAEGWEMRERLAIVDHRLLATIEAHGIEVVILDPWAVFYGGSENSNDEVETALAALHESLPASVTLIVLHHFGKANEGRQAEDLWRGASRLADWAANRVTLTFPVKADPAAGVDRHEARRWLHQTALRRNDPAPDDVTLWRTDDGWLEVADPSVMPTQTGGLSHRDFLAALERAGGEFASDNEAAKLLGVAAKTVKRVAVELVGAGAVVRIEGRQGVPTATRLARL